MAKIKLVFYGELVNNEFTMHNRDRFLKYVGKMAGQDKTKPVRIKMTVEKVRKSRTEQQNKYYWGVVVALIADELGYNPWERQEVHNALKLAVRGGLGDKRLQVPISTSTMNTSEFSEYVEDCRRWASLNLSIDIPDATSIESDDFNEQFIH